MRSLIVYIGLAVGALAALEEGGAVDRLEKRARHHHHHHHHHNHLASIHDGAIMQVAATRKPLLGKKKKHPLLDKPGKHPLLTTVTIIKPAPTPVPAPVPAPAPVSPAPAPASPAPAPAPVSPAPAPPASGLTGLAADAIAQHNAYRAKHAAGALVWNATMAQLAQSWVNKCVFSHSGGSLGPLGENIAAGQSSIAEAFAGWTTSGNPSEEQQYNPNNPQGSHFTQVVWKGTQQLGCAVASCNMPDLNNHGNSQYFACEYYPAGNVGVVGDNGANYRANITP